jgi:hypothetical protein
VPNWNRSALRLTPQRVHPKYAAGTFRLSLTDVLALALAAFGFGFGC